MVESFVLNKKKKYEREEEEGSPVRGYRLKGVSSVDTL
jgi:hypothetical protein